MCKNKECRCSGGNCKQSIALPAFCVILGTDFRYRIEFENVLINDSTFKADYFDISIEGGNVLILTLTIEKQKRMGVGQYLFNITRIFTDTNKTVPAFNGILNLQR